MRSGEGPSSIKTLNVGSPQGCALSPLLFVLYTNKLRSISPNNLLLKFADDTAIVGKITANNEDAYKSEVSSVVRWCDKAGLLVNAKKTQELIVDFREKGKTMEKITIGGETIVQQEVCKYLGVDIDRRLTFRDHVRSQSKKMARRMYCVKRLKRAGVTGKRVKLAFSSFVASLITYGSIIHFALLTKKDRRIFLSVIREAEKMELCSTEEIERTIRRRAVGFVSKIGADHKHALYKEVNPHLPGGGRTRRNARMMFCRTERFLNSLIPNALRVLCDVP